MSPYEPRFHPDINSQTGPYRFNEGQLIELFDVIDFECIEIKDTFFHSNSKDDLVINKDDEINNYIHENLTKLQFEISAYFENKENETLKIY